MMLVMMANFIKYISLIILHFCLVRPVLYVPYTQLVLMPVSVMAACAISNIVKSSLGPVGLDKMLVDDIGVSGDNDSVHILTYIYQYMCFPNKEWFNIN